LHNRWYVVIDLQDNVSRFSVIDHHVLVSVVTIAAIQARFLAYNLPKTVWRPRNRKKGGLLLRGREGREGDRMGGDRTGGEGKGGDRKGGEGRGREGMGKERGKGKDRGGGGRGREMPP